MVLESSMDLEAWVKVLPASHIAYPASLAGSLRRYFWRFYTPYHSFFRDILLTLRVLRHEGRQDFLIGKIAPNITVKQFISFLIEKGYGNHFIAWEDEGELVSLRYVEGFLHQYHIRIFNDGEVRGHYEYTPESHFIWHLKEIGIEERREVFVDLFKDRIILDSPIAQLAPRRAGRVVAVPIVSRARRVRRVSKA